MPCVDEVPVHAYWPVEDQHNSLVPNESLHSREVVMPVIESWQLTV